MSKVIYANFSPTSKKFRALRKALGESADKILGTMKRNPEYVASGALIGASALASPSKQPESISDAVDDPNSLARNMLSGAGMGLGTTHFLESRNKNPLSSALRKRNAAIGALAGLGGGALSDSLMKALFSDQ